MSKTEGAGTEPRLELLSPRAEKYLNASQSVARRWDGGVNGKRVTFVDNGRPNANKVLALIESELARLYDIKASWIHKIDQAKPGMGGWVIVPISKIAPDLHNQTDLVITGLGP